MFEYYQNTLCVQGGWLLEAEIVKAVGTYKSLTQRGWLNVLRRGCRNTPSLIEYDSIPERFKQEIVKKAGDPHHHTKHIHFKDYLKHDQEAKEFFDLWTIPSGKALPDPNKEQYLAEAIVLNAIDVMINNKLARKKAIGKSKTNVWQKLADVIHNLPQHQWPHKLPKNSRRLKQKFTIYKKENYESLIHSGFCNKNSEKINDEAKMWLISRYGNPVKKVANIMQLWREYNQEAKKRGWKRLKDELTIYNYLHLEEIKPIWMAHRRGELKAKEELNYQHSTKMPSMRDSLWYADGTKLNYFYRDKNGKVATCQVYEVMDAYSEVLLGYHISKTEDYEAQYHAFKRAAQFAGHRPYELRFDGQGGHKKLKTGGFLAKIAKLSIKTQPYNGKSKTIESAFGRFQQQYLKRDWFFTGQNITAKKDESKANREFISANVEFLPTLKEVEEIYKQRREQWAIENHHSSGIPKIEMYQNSENPKSPKINVWDMVDMFWILREKPIKINAYGITFTEKKKKYTYMKYTKANGMELPDVEWLSNNIGKKFYIKFDPNAMDMIYLYEKTHNGLRFVTEATTKIEVHRNIQEQEDWEAAYFKQVEQLNKNLRLKRVDEMDKILQAHGVLPEDYGLNSPKVSGIQTKKEAQRKHKPSNIGKINKRESNATPLEQKAIDEMVDELI